MNFTRGVFIFQSTINFGAAAYCVMNGMYGLAVLNTVFGLIGMTNVVRAEYEQ